MNYKQVTGFLKSRAKFFFLLLLFLSTKAEAQIFDPVEWSTSVEKVSETEYILVSTAQIEPGWHLYSQDVPEDGPIPTSFSYEEADGYSLEGNTVEDEGRTIHDPVFDMVITFFDNQAEFRQKIKLSNKDLKSVTGEVGFMVCDDERCLPPSYVELNFDLRKSVAASQDAINAVGEQSLKETKQVETSEDSSKAAVADTKKQEKKGLWTIFIIAFFSGFAALLTPCVFPMIPMTVSFFTKQSKTRAKGIKNALIYGLSIIIIYLFLGGIVTWVFGASVLNAFSTSVWFNLIFFIILVIFAISFLGAFEIMLPNSWANKVDKQADKGGVIGIFFMGLALAIVSFSCTGPIVGTLLVEAASKGGIAPFIGMFGFALALALPFALFAAFPGWLNSLPKSGGWLNTVKVVLGFLELALAFKFLSNADLVLQLHLLEREVFLTIWITIFGAMAFYLFGKIRLPHDSPLEHISVGRLSLGLLVMAFTIYMIPGLWGAPLQLISGFPPAMNYSESPYGVGYTKLGSGGATVSKEEFPDGAHLGPHDIVAFTDYEEGLAYARKVNKPVMIDFTGHACVNCRKMEERVWSDPAVLQILKNDIVLISLYVDDKRELPDDEKFTSEISGKELKYIGQKWSEFQTLRYKANAQPFYVLMDLEEENLLDPVGYTPDIQEYKAWLEKGVKEFGKE
ncbi:Thiol:disulfide interchange protein DsbD [Salegentibacter echinorum]|uniref:Thiol:disulfide interchange protein DsbD n=1 Tax=Salegentibacter echinorum TaxID=1073325 RepID=A0A1M5E3Y4_SALEC|nr:thioredoxin family protein [Salegentibacter echinorum]SHF73958.1 Thiol:disulfide interchange protein DsbD [Salegentibacter echinorum]